LDENLTLADLLTVEFPDELEPLQKACRNLGRLIGCFLEKEDNTVGVDDKAIVEKAKKAMSTMFSRSFEIKSPKNIKKMEVEYQEPPEKFILGVVLEPTDGSDGEDPSPDTDNEVYSAEEIRKAAHWFMEHGLKQHGLTHGKAELGGMLFEPGDSRIVLLETYLTPVEIPEDALGEHPRIKKGSWMMGLRINDQKIWSGILADEYQGLSIGGVAMASPFTGGKGNSYE
jgi:hypothetical protein